MDLKQAITIRAKKLGILLLDARVTANLSKKDTGEAIGASAGSITSFETGKRSPSLPELELLSYKLGIPLDHFWKEEIRSTAPSLLDKIHVEHSLSLRNRGIGKILQAKREEKNLTYTMIRDETGISPSRMRRYESGETAVPLPELELLSSLLELQLYDLVDPKTEIGKWIISQRAIQGFADMPVELQDFVSKPINRPYLELAQKLSSLESKELRSVAEGLLEITI